MRSAAYLDVNVRSQPVAAYARMAAIEVTKSGRRIAAPHQPAERPKPTVSKSESAAANDGKQTSVVIPIRCPPYGI